MFEAHFEAQREAAVIVRVSFRGASVSLGSAYELCRGDEAFRTGLVDALAAAPFEAYFWETPAITHETRARPFEFVLTEAPSLVRAVPDLAAFGEHFERDDDHDGVVAFENLGGDALLVAPCPSAAGAADAAYVHLGAFLRGAPGEQIHALFQRTAVEVLERVSEKPLWVSTSGTGVHWLHVRLDSRPKYYQHGPYKSL